MEAAAEIVKHLSRTILPERPHQLAPSPDWKCRHPPDDSAKYCEEWHDTRLQYMTLVNEADRGVLFTRGYYDFRPEPPKPVPREINALARSGAPKKTLSLSDYKNKKGAAASTSPPDSTPSQTPKKLSNSAVATPASEPKSVMESKAPPEPAKKPTSGSNSPAKPKKSGGDIVADTRLPPKPPPKTSLPRKPPTPESKKRVADADDGTRAPKRPKPADAGRSVEDRSHTPREEALRRKTQDPRTARDANSLSDSRLSNSSSLPNGRAILKAATSPNPSGSPPPRSRGNSVNGTRAPAAKSNQGTPTKMDPSKPSVPPLLSPLHFDIEGNKDSYESKKTEKKRREEGADSVKATKSSKNADTQASAKRSKSPVRLPSLLSPTLPPEVEAELEKRGNASPKPSEGRAKDRDVLKNATRPAAEQSSNSAGTKSRGSLVVSLKVPKRVRYKFQQLMKLSQRKEPQRQERPSSATGVAQPVRAEKRPADTSELEPLVSKKPRTSDVSSSSKGPIPPPSTPSKKSATAMSRVSSGNSMTNTPGEPVAATPSVPASLDRTGHERGPPSKATEARIQLLKEKEGALLALGKRLKHNGDMARKGNGDPNTTTNGSSRQGDSGIKIGYVLILECIGAFMTGFHIQDVHRGMANKPCEPNCWTSLFPLIDMLQKDIRRADSRRYGPIYTLSLLLQGVSYDQLINSWTTHEDPSNLIALKQLLRLERSRAKIWPLLREANGNSDATFRVNYSPWTTVEEVVETTLRVLRRWCADEGVDWSAELNLKESGLRSVGQG